MLEPQPAQVTEYEYYSMPIYLQGAGAAAPTLLSRNNFTISRTSAGLYVLTFTDNPNGIYLGTPCGGFADTTLTNAFGWSTACTYTAATATTKATLTVNVGNASNTATDLATTTTLSLTPRFAQVLKNFSATQPI